MSKICSGGGYTIEEYQALQGEIVQKESQITSLAADKAALQKQVNNLNASLDLSTLHIAYGSGDNQTYYKDPILTEQGFIENTGTATSTGGRKVLKDFDIEVLGYGNTTTISHYPETTVYVNSGEVKTVQVRVGETYSVGLAGGYSAARAIFKITLPRTTA